MQKKKNPTLWSYHSFFLPQNCLLILKSFKFYFIFFDSTSLNHLDENIELSLSNQFLWQNGMVHYYFLMSFFFSLFTPSPGWKCF